MTSLMNSVLQRPIIDWAFQGRPRFVDAASNHL
jgi:hypothetical protein